jgi:sodium transport system ATP-binding protein
MIEVNNIAKHFRTKRKGVIRAVDGVTFRCGGGEIFGLLGANGAGKTTLLRVLATMLEPTSGSAKVGGYDIRSEPTQVRRSLGFLSASTAIYGRLTPREMIAYIGSLYGLRGSDLRGRVDRMIEQLEIGPFADQLCDRLSTGQKQRVSIARTLVADPPVLFLDEPTAGLDVLASRTISKFMEEARDAGKTVVFSTHVMSEAERLCGRLGVIHNGKLEAVGTLAELREQTGEQQLEPMFLKLIERAEMEGARA